MLQIFCKRLLNDGLIKRADLEMAIENKKKTGGSLALNLVLAGVLHDEMLAHNYADFLKLKRASKTEIAGVTMQMFRQIPIEIIYDTGVLPLGYIQNERLKVGVVDLSESESIEEAEFFAGCSFEPVIITVTDMAATFERIAGQPWKIPAAELRKRMRALRRIRRTKKEVTNLNVIVRELAKNERVIEKVVTKPDFILLEVLPADDKIPTITLQPKKPDLLSRALSKRSKISLKNADFSLQQPPRKRANKQPISFQPIIQRPAISQVKTPPSKQPISFQPIIQRPVISQVKTPPIKKISYSDNSSEDSLHQKKGAFSASGTAETAELSAPKEKLPSIIISPSLTGFSEKTSQESTPQKQQVQKQQAQKQQAQKHNSQEIFVQASNFTNLLRGHKEPPETNVFEEKAETTPFRSLKKSKLASQPAPSVREKVKKEESTIILDLDDIEIVEESLPRKSPILVSSSKILTSKSTLRLHVAPAQRSHTRRSIFDQTISRYVQPKPQTKRPSRRSRRKRTTSHSVERKPEHFGTMEHLRVWLGKASVATQRSFRAADLAIEDARARDAIALAILESLASIYPTIVLFSLRHPNLIIWNAVIKHSNVSSIIGAKVNVESAHLWQRVREGESYLGPIPLMDPILKTIPELVGQETIIFPVRLNSRTITILLLDGGHAPLASPGRFLAILQSGIADAFRRMILMRKRSLQVMR